MNNLKKCLVLATVSSLFTLAPAAHAATNTFDGNTFSVDYGVSAVGPSSFFSLAHVDVTGSASTIEVPGMSGWIINTVGNTLSFTWNQAADFMNFGTPAFIGFKISDTGNHLANILGASVTNTAYTPSVYGNLVEGFDPATKLTFDADNIFVNMNTAMWHETPMASMGDPYRDLIAISVNFQSAAPIPEPETYAMLLAGLSLMGSIIRRRQVVDKSA